ncbi:MAG: metallophosphoesterase, partial [Candidatus Aminicenantes bacterium]
MRELNKTLARKLYRFTIISVFILVFITNLFSEDIRCEWTGVERIVAVGDLHGDYDNFIEILKDPEIGILDDNLRWIAGKTHLVQIGDIMDRGPDAKKIFVLLKRLEGEAEESGGKVHMLIGNHEEMNISDIAFDRRGYVSVEQLMSFLPEEYIEKEERKIRKRLKIPSSDEGDSKSEINPNIRAFWEEKIRNSMNVTLPTRRHVRWHYRREFNKNYAPWILQHNAAIKINGIIFVHGGISEKYSTWPLQRLNDRLRKELEMFRVARLLGREPRPTYEIVFDENGPLWYRDYSYRGPEFEPILDKILKNLGATSIVTAHTPRPLENEAEMSRYSGKVWIIDTNISSVYPQGKLSALIIESSGKPHFKPWLKSRTGEEASTHVDDKSEDLRLIVLLTQN